MKPKVAFFDFACCEGCQLQVANFGEELLDILEVVDVVNFREVMSENGEDYDIAIIEGSITNQHAVERIKKIREKAKIVIAYGACACTGGINAMKNNFEMPEIMHYVYKDDAKYFDTIPTKAVDQVVKVDYYVHGCPVYPKEFVDVLKCVLQGVEYKVPEKSVCTECKLNENECMFDKGLTCMGPITKAGCNSWCINNGNICFGCRGFVENPAKNAAIEVLKDHGLNPELIIKKINMYNTVLDEKLKKKGEE